MKHLVRTPEDALAYLTECTLATVADLKMKKSASKNETERQIGIAQFGVNWCEYAKINFDNIKTTRVKDVLERFSGDVKEWSEQYHP